MENWKDLFLRQLDSMNYWSKLFKDSIKHHKFLERGDALFIIKKAEKDAVENIINKYRDSIPTETLSKIKSEMKEKFEKDDSGLGFLK